METVKNIIIGFGKGGKHSQSYSLNTENKFLLLKNRSKCMEEPALTLPVSSLKRLIIGSCSWNLI